MTVISGKRIGLVGCGEWGKHVLRDLVNLGAAVTVMARSDESRARAENGGASSIVSNVEEIPDVDGIVVVVPVSRHVDVLERVLPRGVPVFIEKPMTDHPESADRMAAMGAGRLFVMEKWRYHSAIRRASEIIRSGRLGEIRGISTRRVQPGTRHHGTDAIWVLLPHDVSIFHELAGGLPEPGIAVAERTPDGRVAGLVSLSPGPPFFAAEVSVRSPVHRREIRVEGDQAVLFWDDSSPAEIRIFRGVDFSSVTAADVERIELEDSMPLFDDLKGFLEFLDGGPPPRCSAAVGALCVRWIAGIRSRAGLPANDR